MVSGTQTLRSAVLMAPSASEVAYRQNDGSSYPSGRQPQDPDPTGVTDPPKVAPELGDLPSGDVAPGGVVDAQRASVAASRQRSNANLQAGTAATAARARAGKRARESAILSRDELAQVLSRALMDKSLPAHAMAPLAGQLMKHPKFQEAVPVVERVPESVEQWIMHQEFPKWREGDSCPSCGCATCGKCSAAGPGWRRGKPITAPSPSEAVRCDPMAQIYVLTEPSRE